MTRKKTAQMCHCVKTAALASEASDLITHGRMLSTIVCPLWLFFGLSGAPAVGRIRENPVFWKHERHPNPTDLKAAPRRSGRRLYLELGGDEAEEGQ